MNIENFNKQEGGTKVISKGDKFENIFLFDGILDVLDQETVEEYKQEEKWINNYNY